MSKRARLIFPGVPFHIIQRGSSHQARYFAYEDYQFIGSCFATSGNWGRAIEAIRKATNGNFVLDDERFTEHVAAVVGRRVVPAKFGRSWKRRDRECEE